MSLSQQNLLPVTVSLALAICLRSAIMMQSYSGESKPPMFGDYEAQRHWMEITVNLPPSEWYTNTTSNDLNYWGLDYPPLTAYHSYFLGLIARSINHSWIELNTSRGIETPDHKRFMRVCVLISDSVSFVIGSIIFSFHTLKGFKGTNILSELSTSVIFLSFPGIILMDHGHFQFNCVSLGFYLLSLCLFTENRDLLGTVSFCFALMYKQMELYHALPLFVFLLAKCFEMRSVVSGLTFLMKLIVCVCLTLGIILIPFLSSFQLLEQVAIRMFPIARGLFEDKVANFWCVSSVIVKWKDVMSTSNTVACCAILTFFCSLPALLRLFRRPTIINLLLSESIVSLSFFLFSFQVHEKSILLVAIPSLCLAPIFPLTSIYFSIVSVLSMWPLILKDGLVVATISLLCIFYVLCTICLSLDGLGKRRVILYRFWPLTISLLGFFLIVLFEAIVSPPPSYPFIFPLLISGYSFIHFVGFYSYWLWQLIKCD